MGGTIARNMSRAKRLLVVGALCLGLAFALNGCSQAPSQNAPESADGAAQTDQAAQNETRTFTDSAGRTVEVPAKSTASRRRATPPRRSCLRWHRTSW